MEKNTLQHWGVKGMRWGVRRYQSSDGTLTAAGKKRYARDAREKGYKDQDESGQYYRKTKKGRDTLGTDVNRYVKEDLERSKGLVDSSHRLTSDLKRVTDNSIKNRPKAKMDLSKMSDKEMRDRINREILERQYNDMFAPQTSTRGREYASRILETTGDVLMVAGSALGVALSIKALRGE